MFYKHGALIFVNRNANTVQSKAQNSEKRHIRLATNSIWYFNLSHHHRDSVCNTLKRFPFVESVREYNCSLLFDNNTAEIQRALSYQREPSDHLPLDNCLEFLDSLGYILHPLNSIEADFPIAYSMLVYTNIEQVERLLRVIYRPQNYYCIHVDQKSSGGFYTDLQQLAGCFPNVFLSERRVDMVAGQYSILEAELICMKQLLAYRWRYFINLTGMEYPLHTNWEIVQILRAMRGANLIRSTYKRYKHFEFEFAIADGGVMSWKRFPHCWPFVRESIGDQWNHLIMAPCIFIYIYYIYNIYNIYIIYI